MCDELAELMMYGIVMHRIDEEGNKHFIPREQWDIFYRKETTMKLATITDRCIQWNEQRYDQVYDYELAARLLLEETEELYAATVPVERLDAIGDIMFVAIGVFWKLGFNKEQVEDIFHREDLATLSMEDANHVSQSIILFGMDELSNDLVGAYPGLSLACYSVFITALGALRGMGLQHRVYDVVHAICDSNATKEVKGKVNASVKANVVKGAGFVPPTEALRAIYISSHNSLDTIKREEVN